MSDTIPTHMIDTFRDGIELIAQQMPSKLRSKVTEWAETGERVAIDQLGSVKARKITERHGDTQYNNTPHRRRWVTMDEFEVADLLDRTDMLKILNDPRGPYAEDFVAAMNREIDTTIIAAMTAPAASGRHGTEFVNFNASNRLLHGGTGFTLDKVRRAMRRLKAGNAVENPGATDLCIAWTSAQEEEFINTNEVKSIDYTDKKVMVAGGMDGVYYGFEYVRLEDWEDDETGTWYEILPYDTGAGARKCYAWRKDGMVLNMPKGPGTEVDKLPSKRGSWQIRNWASFGAVRRQEKKVVEIECLETLVR